jgi:hypothetical protein
LVKHYYAPIDLQRRFATEDVEELLGFVMNVPGLAGSRRHSLLNDVQPVVLYQVPAIATIAPAVMLGVPRTGSVVPGIKPEGHQEEKEEWSMHVRF